MVTSEATLALPPSRTRYIGVTLIATLIVTLGGYVIGPILLIVINSFNVARFGEAAVYGLDNWRIAFSQPALLQSLWNTVMVFWLYTVIAFPVAVLIAWILARTRIPFSHAWEMGFWLSYMLPGLATTVGWIYAFDPHIGIINDLVARLPFIDGPIFNIFSVPGIVFAHLMGNAISQKVMLLTPAFRNMDSALEEAARVGGASNLRTMLRITLPVMVPPIAVVFMLNIVRIFNSFETELLLGIPANFYVFSTKVYQLARQAIPPQPGQATALASLTMVVIALVIPLQKWLLSRRLYTTVTGQMKPALVSLGPWQPLATAFVIFVILLLVPVPMIILALGSFMNKVGFFDFTPTFTLKHWSLVFADEHFWLALRTTLGLAAFAGIASPLLFSIIAYILVQTKLRGRATLDSIVWSSAAVPGMLSSLGLLWLILGMPFLRPAYGTIYIMFLVVLLQGMLTGVQIFKGSFLQVGRDMEDAARVAGAGWIRTYFKVWLPIIMPSMIMIAVMNFVIAANTTTSIILLASRETRTLSILALELMISGDAAQYEAAGIVSLIIVTITMTVALVARSFGYGIGIRAR
jgi:iron(III) transport system permease protein